MNAGISLVRAYLNLNGYFTATDVPVIRLGREGAFHEITDIDLMAVRFPFAAHVVPLGMPGPQDDLRIPTDKDLHIDPEAVDIIIAQVSEGRPSLNPSLRSVEVLERALARVGCVPPPDTERVVKELRERGEARLEAGDAPAATRIRLMAFGDGKPGREDTHTVASLRRTVRFVARNLRDYQDIIRPARNDDALLGAFHLLEEFT